MRNKGGNAILIAAFMIIGLGIAGAVAGYGQAQMPAAPAIDVQKMIFTIGLQKLQIDQQEDYIKALVAEINRLAAELRKAQDSKPADGIPRPNPEG